MKTSPVRRALALLLCCQPFLWKSNVALAQSMQPGLSVASPGDQWDRGTRDERQWDRGTRDERGSPTTLPSSLSDVEVARPERATQATLGTALPALDAAIDPDAYVCGPGDVLELNFWGLQNFRLRSPVDLEGRAFVPKVGYFELRGKTLAEARRLIRESVTRYYPRLSFDVVLSEPRTFVVQVVDAVSRPGSYPARAVDRLATIVARAGGFAPNGSQRRIEIRRRDGRVLKPDLLLFSLTGDVAHNPFLLDGDVVRVPFADLVATIGGGVNRPGRYELVGTRDLAELLSLAGGLAPTATPLLPVSVVSRLADDQQDQKLVPFTPAGAPLELKLLHEDVVRIATYSEIQRSVLVIGAIGGAQLVRGKAGDATTAAPEEASATRRMAFVEGDSVRTLLERVGGVGPLADLERSYILRKGAAIPVNLHALLMLRDLTADRPIALDDTLVVPFKRRNILVEGAVFRPGEYAFNPSFGIDQYLSLAGGRNRFALEPSDVRVVSPTGQMTPYRTDLRVDPGSTLVVPERNFSRAEIVQIAIAIASVALSGAAVVLAARK